MREGNYMPEIKDISPKSETHIEIINGATYIVTSNYVGNITLFELLKQMLKRDFEKTDNNV
jgi:hypothetical protein